MKVLFASGSVQTLFALLCAGHLLADFLFQTHWMVTGKRARLGPLLAHGAEVLIVQALVLLPFVSNRAFAWAPLMVIALAHVAIDAFKVRVEARWGRRLLWFGLDQLLHFGVLIAAASLLARAPATQIREGLDPATLTRFALVSGIYAFNVNGGSAVVSAVLAGFRPENAASPSADEFHAGHVIGILERMVMLTLVWLGQWGALGFVLTAKSVARFKELESREFAETYLVGTLTSFLVAGASGLLLRALIS